MSFRESDEDFYDEVGPHLLSNMNDDEHFENSMANPNPLSGVYGVFEDGQHQHSRDDISRSRARARVPLLEKGVSFSLSRQSFVFSRSHLRCSSSQRPQRESVQSFPFIKNGRRDSPNVSDISSSTPDGIQRHENNNFIRAKKNKQSKNNRIPFGNQDLKRQSQPISYEEQKLSSDDNRDFSANGRHHRYFSPRTQTHYPYERHPQSAVSFTLTQSAANCMPHSRHAKSNGNLYPIMNSHNKVRHDLQRKSFSLPLTTHMTMDGKEYEIWTSGAKFYDYSYSKEKHQA